MTFLFCCLLLQERSVWMAEPINNLIYFPVPYHIVMFFRSNKPHNNHNPDGSGVQQDGNVIAALGDRQFRLGLNISRFFGSIVGWPEKDIHNACCLWPEMATTVQLQTIFLLLFMKAIKLWFVQGRLPFIIERILNLLFCRHS